MIRRSRKTRPVRRLQLLDTTAQYPHQRHSDSDGEDWRQKTLVDGRIDEVTGDGPFSHRSEHGDKHRSLEWDHMLLQDPSWADYVYHSIPYGRSSSSLVDSSVRAFTTASARTHRGQTRQGGCP